jgi:hypothetical protein
MHGRYGEFRQARLFLIKAFYMYNMGRNLLTCKTLKLQSHHHNILINMRKVTSFKTLIFGTIALLMSTVVFAQGDKASRPSPAATASGTVGGANITIAYSSPAVKGRKIFGELIPYDKAWRAGANEATILETDKAIKIGGTQVPAGKYSLFAVPNATEWTFILNSETGQWGIKRGGEANRDPAKDVATVKVKPSKSSVANERLVYTVGKKGFTLAWDDTEVTVPIK